MTTQERWKDQMYEGHWRFLRQSPLGERNIPFVEDKKSDKWQIALVMYLLTTALIGALA